MSIWGALSSMHVNLDYSQYGLILGFLNNNLGEPVEAFERPSSFVADPLEEHTVCTPKKHGIAWPGMAVLHKINGPTTG